MNEAEAYQQAWEESRPWLGANDSEFKSGWQAACEWMRGQGEPYAYIYEFDSKVFGVHRSFSSNQWNGLNPSRCVMVYPAPPAAQINEQMREALQRLLAAVQNCHCENSGAAQELAQAALEAATPK